MGSELGEALAAADLAYVTAIYAAREQPIDGVTADLVANAARTVGTDTRCVLDRTVLTDELVRIARSGDAMIFLGAGDITHAARDVIEGIRRRATESAS